MSIIKTQNQKIGKSLRKGKNIAMLLSLTIALTLCVPLGSVYAQEASSSNPTIEASGGTASDGTASDGTASDGTASDGTASDDTTSGGTASDDTASDDTASDDTASDGTANVALTPDGAAELPVSSVTVGKAVDADKNVVPFTDADTNVKKDANVAIAIEFEISGAVKKDAVYEAQLDGPVAFSDHDPIPLNEYAAAEITKSGLIKITILQDSEQLENSKFVFEDKLDASKITNEGAQSVAISAGGQSADININFAFDQIEAKAEAVKAYEIDAANSIIHWTVTATPDMQNAAPDDRHFTDFNFIDTIPDGLTYAPGSAKIANGSSDLDSSAVTVTEPSADSKALTAAVNAGDDGTVAFPNDSYTLKYDTTYVPSELTPNKDGKCIFKSKAHSEFKYPQYELDALHKVKTAANPKSGKSNDAEKPAEITVATVTKAGALENIAAINWEIKVKSDISPAKPHVTDVLPVNNALSADTLALNADADGTGGTAFNLKSSETTPEFPYYTSVTANGKTTLDFYLNPASISAEQKITYSTALDINADNSFGNIDNKAEFYGNDKLLTSKTATVKYVDSVVGKSGVYDKTNHTVKWTITPKDGGKTSKNITIVDTIPDGQYLINTADEAKIEADIASITADTIVSAAGSKALGYVHQATNPDGSTLGKQITIEYAAWDDFAVPITYTTRLADDDNENNFWATNLAKDQKKATNSLNIKVDTFPDDGYNAAASVPVNSTVLEKRAETYDYTAHTLAWEVKVNQNRMEMTAPVIVDTLDKGWSYDQSSVRITDGSGHAVTAESTVFSAVDEKSTMTIELSDLPKASDSYITIKYTAVLDDLTLLDKKTLTARNTAKLTAAEIPSAGVTVSPTKEIGSSVIAKSGAKVSKQPQIEWSININNNLAVINVPSGTVKIEDKLPDDLEPLLDTVTLFNAAVASGGTLTAGSRLDATEYAVDYNPSTRILSVDFKQPSINSAYVIKFVTDALATKDFQNSAYYSHTGDSAEHSDTSDPVGFSAGWGDAGAAPVYKDFIISKIDSVGADNPDTVRPLEGAVFTLTNGANVVRAVSDASGSISFRLKKGVEYTIEETAAPNGFVLPAAKKWTVSISADSNSFKVREGDKTEVTYAVSSDVHLTVQNTKPTTTPRPGTGYTPTYNYPTPEYTITQALLGSSAANDKGSISVNVFDVLTIVPDVGYEISEVFIDGVSVGAITTYSFDGKRSHDIRVVYKKIGTSAPEALPETVTNVPQTGIITLSPLF